VLFALRWLSELPTVEAKKRALSLIIASLRGKPCLWWFRAQFASARSMSGNFPFDLLMGERLPSSWYKYFSFWRKTLETVLHYSQHGMARVSMQYYLLSTPNIAKISLASCAYSPFDECKHTSNLRLLHSGVLLVILAHSSTIRVCERFPRSRRCA
jgi:hypothetical protein